MDSPIICFGQQPCGFFPKRFLVAKINTAKKLQTEIGGRVVFFYHDSDADYRETITLMRDRLTGDEVRLNFIQKNKLQKKHSPLYLKRIPAGWKEEMLKQLPRVVKKPLVDLFASVEAKNAADFCLEMYKKLGLLEGIEIIRSSDPHFRKSAPNIIEGYADVEYQGEIVRAKIEPNRLALHEGGGVYTYLPKPGKLNKEQITPGADERFKWMREGIHCNHYIYGEGEKEYLKFSDFPDVKFLLRDEISEPSFAWIPQQIF